MGDLHKGANYKSKLVENLIFTMESLTDALIKFNIAPTLE